MSILDRKHILTIDLDDSSIDYSKNIKFYNTDKGISNLYVRIRKTDDDGAKIYLNESDLEGLKLNLTVVKPKTNQTRDMVGALTKELTNYTCAIYKFELSNEFTNQIGIVCGEFNLTDGVEYVTIDPFSYEIKASKLTGLNAEIISNPDLPILKELIDDVKSAQQWISNIDDKNVSEVKTYSSKKIDEQFNTIVNSNLFNKYGNIVLPIDFKNNIDFDIFRDFDGKIKHNFRYTDNSTKIYYVSENGATTNDGLTEQTPTTLPKAIEYAEATTDTNIKIVLLGKYMSKDKLWSGSKTLINLSKNYYFTAKEECCNIGNICRNLSWTVHKDNVYKCSRTLVNNVVDLKHRTVNNMPSDLKKVETITECEQTKNTYYTDGTTLYVHRYDKSQVLNDEIYVSLNNVYPFSFSLTKDVMIVFENINFINNFGIDVDNLYIESPRTTTQGFAILLNCNFIGGGGRNGFASYNLKNTWLFNCYARGTLRDGLNYHNLVDGDSFVFEYECGGYDCGINDTNENNNATTAHEGIRILRIGTKGWNTKGPVLADVNGCYSICYDCTMHDSIRSSHVLEKTAFQFGGTVSSVNSNPPKKAILYNCSGGGLDTATLTTTGNFGTVYVNNLKGNKVYKSVVLEYID